MRRFILVYPPAWNGENYVSGFDRKLHEGILYSKRVEDAMQFEKVQQALGALQEYCRGNPDGMCNTGLTIGIVELVNEPRVKLVDTL